MTISDVATANAMPQIAVDRTASRSRGTIYVTWSGSPNGKNTDVLVSDSLNKGVSFSFPKAVSSPPAVGAGRFQTNPAIAVDNDAQAAVCFYQTPTNTPTTSSIYSYHCVTSINHGATWQLTTAHNGVPLGYGAVTTDFLLHNDGFLRVFETQTNGTRRAVGQELDIR